MSRPKSKKAYRAAGQNSPRKPKIGQRQRREKRIKKNLLANLSERGFEELGLTANISKKGLFVAAPEVFPSCHEIIIMLAAGDHLFRLKGEVRWNVTQAEQFTENINSGMGIKILEAPDEYIQYVQELKEKKKKTV